MPTDAEQQVGSLVLTEGAGWPEPDELAALAALVRESFAGLAPRLDAMVSRFYAVLFTSEPQLRELFPINMESQRGRFTRVLVHLVGALERPAELAAFLAQLGRDHRKFDVSEKQFPVFGHALLAALADTAGERWTPDVAHAWARVYQFVAGTMILAARTETGPASWRGEVIEHRRLDSDVALVRVRTDPPLRYRPGQYVAVEVPRRPRVWRPYTPLSTSRPDGELELLVKAVGYGGVSRAIVSATRPGDLWRLGAPLGRLASRFTPERPLVMVGGGTGIAPVQALLSGLEHASSSPRDVAVYYGTRRWEQLYAQDALRELADRNSWLDVITVVEETPTEAGPEIGTLADVVVAQGKIIGADVVVSGSPAMVRATVRALLVAGLPVDAIHYDPFVED